MIEREINGLSNLVQGLIDFCARKGYDHEKTQTMMEEKCRGYVDVIMAVIAVNPALREALLKVKPSLESYLEEGTKRHLAMVPSCEFFAKGLEAFLSKGRDHYGKNGLRDDKPDFVYDNLAIAWLSEQIDRYGFAQELVAAVNRVKPELMTYLAHKYSSALSRASVLEEHTGYSHWWE